MMEHRLPGAVVWLAVLWPMAFAMAAPAPAVLQARRAPSPASSALRYTFVTSWTVEEGEVVGGSLCPASMPLPRAVGDIAYDAAGRLMAGVCCGVASRTQCMGHLAVVDAAERQARSWQLPLLEADRPMAYDPTTDSLVSSSATQVFALALPDGKGAVRRWWLLRVADGTSNVPQDLALGPDGTVFTFARAGVGRYGPSSQRYSPWRPTAAPRPGSLFVDADGRVYVHDANLGGSVARFSSTGSYDAAWRLQEPASLLGPVAGYPGSRAVYLLGVAAAGGLGVWRLDADGAVTARLPVSHRLLAAPMPALAVALDGSYALKGRDTLGAVWLFLHAPDGTERMALQVMDPSPSLPAAASSVQVSAGLDNRILVSSFQAMTIFAADGTQLNQWSSPYGTMAAVVGPDGAVYVWRHVSAGVSLLERRDAGGTLEWSSELDAEAGSGLALTSRRLFAGLRLRGAVAVHDLAGGLRIGLLQTSTPDEVFLPDELAVDGEGRLYVLDRQREEMQVWDLAVSALRPVGRIPVGSTSDGFGPVAIAARGDGALAVIEAGVPEGATSSLTRVRLLDGQGGTLWVLDAPSGPMPDAWFEDVAFDSRGRLILVGTATPLPAAPRHTVLVFAPESEALTPPPPATATPAPTPLPANEGVCRVTGDKWAQPGEIWLGEAVTVTLTLGQTCPTPTSPADIVLAVDTSGSMAGDKAKFVGQAVKAFAAGLDLTRHRLGVVTFATTARLVQPLTSERDELSRLPGNFGADGSTNMHDAIRLASSHLLERGRPEAKRVVVLFTDGEPNEGGDPEPAAVAARLAGIRIFAVGTVDANMETLLRITAALDRVYRAISERQLPELYRKIADLIGADAGRVALEDILGTDVAFVPDSSSEPPLGLAPDSLRWGWPGFATAPTTVTYRVRPLRPGWVPTNREAWLDYEDADGAVRRYVYPVPRVLVKVRWTTTPTTTATPTPAPSPTATATPTSTPRPGKTYLPIALREPPCQPEKQRIDVVLVIDTSSSMLEPTRAGRQKLEAARQAAGAFLDRLRLGTGDQAALVYFNREAWLAHGLTSDRRALDRVLARQATAMQTCLVCGVEAAHAELRSARRRDAAKPVIVLLTDGLSNPRPASEAVAAARRAKSSGIVIFTIGLGRELDLDALRDMASEPGYFYQTSDAEALDGIYAAIAVEIPCPAGAYWGRRQ